MKTTFSTTQFLLLFAVNAVALMLIAQHYFSLKERVVTKTNTVTKTVVQTKTVKVDDKALYYMSLMKAAQDACKNNELTNNENLTIFHLDQDNKPIFECSH